MREPIKVGDFCVVVSGTRGTESPNIGAFVFVRKFKGEHILYGRIFECEGHNLITELGAKEKRADFAAKWLRKIEPPAKQDQKVVKIHDEEKVH